MTKLTQKWPWIIIYYVWRGHQQHCIKSFIHDNDVTTLYDIVCVCRNSCRRKTPRVYLVCLVISVPSNAFIWQLGKRKRKCLQELLIKWIVDFWQRNTFLYPAYLLTFHSRPQWLMKAIVSDRTLIEFCSSKKWWRIEQIWFYWEFEITYIWQFSTLTSSNWYHIMFRLIYTACKIYLLMFTGVLKSLSYKCKKKQKTRTLIITCSFFLSVCLFLFSHLWFMSLNVHLVSYYWFSRLLPENMIFEYNFEINCLTWTRT